MNTEEYITSLKNQIRDKGAKELVAREMLSHIEDQSEDYESQGIAHDEAVAKAVKEMGDPVSVGTDLNRIHRPHMEWHLFILVVFISITSLLVQAWVNASLSSHQSSGILENLGRRPVAMVVVGLATMLLVYRLDYTILSGKSKILGLIYLMLISSLALNFGCQINGVSRWVSLGGITLSVHSLILFYLPIFAGILYDYRGRGYGAMAKIVAWMFAPIVCLILCGNASLPVIAMLLISETILFTLALCRDWYQVKKLPLILGGLGASTGAIVLGLVYIASRNGYQTMRLGSWLSRIGIGASHAGDPSGMDYINNMLSQALGSCNMFTGSDMAVNYMKSVPGSQSDFILGSVGASCGMIAVIGIVALLGGLSWYILRISLRQNNALGFIVGSASAVAIGIQALSNVLIVFGVLPLTESVLPMFNIGMSSILANYALLGLILSIYRYKDIRSEIKTTSCEA